MRFSKPFSLRLENGILLGSAHTRSSRAWAVPETAIIKMPAANLRKGKDIQHPSLVCVLRQVLHHAGKSQCRRFVARVQAARNDCSSPSTNARQYRHILFPIGAFIRRGLPNNSRAGFELPQQRSVICIHCLEPSIERAVENYVSTC